MGFFGTIALIFRYLPMIVKAIRLAEELIPGKGKGEEKLSAAGDIIKNVSDAIGVPEADKDAVLSTLPKIAGVVVGALNGSGEFKKSGDIPPEVKPY